MKETDLVRQIIQYLNLKGHFVQRTNSGVIRIPNQNGGLRMVKLAQAGTSDITGCSKDGRFIAIECKIKPNKPTELQESYLRNVQDRGGIALVAYSLDDVISVLQ